jgi:sulfatase modifying factor 1
MLLRFPRVALAALLTTVALAGASCLFPSLDGFSECADGCGGSSNGGGGGSSSSSSSAATGSGGETSAATSSSSSVSSSGSSTSGGTGGDGPLPCELTAGMHGPEGVQITPAGGFPTFCVDSTEVTVAQYREFYEGNNFPVPTKYIPALCGWKATSKAALRPKGHGAGGAVVDYIWGHYDTKQEEQRPVQGVDWCDAAIFCAWSGKRLCGSENPASRHLDTADSVWKQSGEWRRACGGEAQTLFGYGSTAMAGLCNAGGGPKPGEQSPFNTTDVTVPATCVATWPAGAVHGMNGNAQEHEDNCDDGSGATPDKDVCHPRGGTYVHDPLYTACDYAETGNTGYTRGNKAEYTGIRCCW